MPINKIVKNGEVLLDVSQDTVEALHVLYDKTFHLASGESATGTIPTKNADDVYQAEKKMYIPAGYYATLVIKDCEITGTEATTATAADVLYDKKFYTETGALTTGTIETKSEKDVISVEGVVHIPAGYYAISVDKQGDPSYDANATAADILYNQTAYAKGVKLTGSIRTKTAKDISHSNNIVSVPKGYYADATTEYTIPKATYDTNNISATLEFVPGSGYNITAKVVIPPGYYNETVSKTFTGLIPAPGTEGTSEHIQAGYIFYNALGESVTGSMAQSQAATYYTSVSDRIINGSQYLAGAQTIKGVLVSDIDPAYVKSGVQITVGDSDDATRITNVTGTAALTYNSETKELTLPGWAVTLE